MWDKQVKIQVQVKGHGISEQNDGIWHQEETGKKELENMVEKLFEKEKK